MNIVDWAMCGWVGGQATGNLATGRVARVGAHHFVELSAPGGWVVR